MGAQEHSVVSSAGSISATDLSKRTDRTHYTIPDDGREITLHPERRRRRRTEGGGGEGHSVLSAGTNASLLIEYFEQGKAGGGPSGRRPSVRVKVTPSSGKKTRTKDGSTIFSDGGSSQRPSHIHRISMSPNDEKTGVADRGRVRSYSGDQSTLSSITSAADDSNISPRPLNVTVIREAGSPGSYFSSPRDIDDPAFRRRRRGTSRTNTQDTFYEDDNLKVSRQRRSRSVSGETDLVNDSPMGIVRRRSRSASRGGMTSREKRMIEQGVQQELERMKQPRTRKASSSGRTADDDGLKPSHARNRNRGHEPVDEIAVEKARARKKAALMESNGTNNPAIIDLIKDTIKQMVLPEIEEIKASQKRNIDQEIALSRANSKRPGPSSSLPDFASPSVVLSPEADKGNGPSLTIVESPRAQEAESELSNSRAPGFGIGPSPHSPLHSEPEGEGVSLVGALEGVERAEMPPMPPMPFRGDSPGVSAMTRASIQTARSAQPPYPATATAMPSSGTTPPPPAPLNAATRTNTANTTHTSAPAADNIPALDLNQRAASSPAHSTLSTRALALLSTAKSGSVDSQSVASYEPGDDHAERVNAATNQSSTGYSNASIEKDRAAPSYTNRADLFYAEQRDKLQEQALTNPKRYKDASLAVHHMSTEPVDSDLGYHDVDIAQNVYALGANPSMRSTPVNAASAHASVLNPSNLDGLSNLSFRNSQPRMTASALPVAHSPMPDLGYLAEQDEDLQTNPSEIQGPISGKPNEWLAHHASLSSVGQGYSAARALSPSDVALAEAAAQRSALSRLASPQLKDEGYISNPPLSVGNITPLSQMGKSGIDMGGLDEMLSEVGFYGAQSTRNVSGNSHGMSSPLYDGATGNGMDRIQSKDIVALMEHLTVRDAQRNARDTEILVTLVRSAAEMRNSFEDMRKQLEDSKRQIVSDVDQNTERSVQKLIQGPRPLPPSAPRRPRYEKSEDESEEAKIKRQSIFKRALKGLSNRSPNELQRIEDMLCQLIDDVEDLRDSHVFYQQQVQSMSSNTIQNPSIHGSQDQPVHGNVTFAAPPVQQAVAKGPDNTISQIKEDDVLEPPQEVNDESLPLDTLPHPKMPAASTNLGNTPSKANKRESNSSSIFPRISRWSETTASSGFKNIFSKGKEKYDGSEASRSQADFNFWETEAAKGNGGDHYEEYNSDGHNTPRAGSPHLLPSSRDGEMQPINHASRVSLDILHPQPRMIHNHALEKQAQQMIANGDMLVSPNNNSVSSLGTFPPIGPGGFQNGQLLSPLAKDAYLQHQLQTSPNANAGSGPARLSKIPQDGPDPNITFSSITGDSSPTRSEKKHRERDESGRRPKKERTEEEKQRRREKKQRRERERAEGIIDPSRKKKKSKDHLDEESQTGMSGRTPSTASRLNGPRPLSNASNKENKKYRPRTSMTSDDNFGGQLHTTYENYETYR